MKKNIKIGLCNLIITISLAISFVLYEIFILEIKEEVIISSFLLGLYFISPAYIANGFAVIFGKTVGGAPIDFNKLFLDKKPIFGRGKTYSGFIGGILMSALLGGIIYYFINYNVIYQILLSYNVREFDRICSLIAFSRRVNYISAFIIGFGALVGDLVGSFIKRRLGLKRGAFFPLLDQIDFIIGALIFSYFIIMPDLLIILTIIFITPAAHAIGNIIGYLAGIKKEPW